MLAKSQCRQPELGVSIRGANAPLARYSRYEERPRWALPLLAWRNSIVLRLP